MSKCKELLQAENDLWIKENAFIKIKANISNFNITVSNMNVFEAFVNDGKVDIKTIKAEIDVVPF